MLTKTIVYGSIEILQTFQMQVREDTVIDEDGVEISRSFHRTVYNPGDDVSTALPPIPELAALLWTPEVIAAWQVELAKIKAKMLPTI